MQRAFDPFAHLVWPLGITFLAFWLCSCGSAPAAPAVAMPSSALARDEAVLIVDCLMPARQPGTATTDAPPRHPLRLPARDCTEAGGEYALPNGDAVTALKLSLPFALKGDVRAQTRVGELYEAGIGTLPDPAAAAIWYRRAADGGDRHAMMNLASLLDRGVGVNRDPEEAAQWFRRSSGLAAAPTKVTIYILDPVMLIPSGAAGQETWSTTLRRRRRAITGRVISDAPVRQVTVNGVPAAADERGVFQIAPKLLKNAKALNIAASDERGREAQIHLRLTSGARDQAGVPPTELNIRGDAHALIIANQAYEHWPVLDTPLKDGRKIKTLLERRFGFQTTLMVNATRREILGALSSLREQLGDDDRLLLFYAGHGDVDPVTGRGYWIPVDGERHLRSNWISVLDVTDQLNAIPARQVLVVADSCYSGTMARSALGSVDAELSAESRTKALNRLAQLRARVAMTSGGEEPVVDGGAGKNSLFTRSLLDVLGAVDRPIEAQRVFDEVSARFGWRARELGLSQRPDYAPIRFAGHAEGDFIFVPKQH